MTLSELRAKQGDVSGEAHGDAHTEHHPDALRYVQIGLFLAVITAIEVALYYIDMSRGLLVGLLMILSIIKFAMVVMFFMHLRFDNKLFTILFATGLTATFILFAVVLGMHGGNFVDI